MTRRRKSTNPTQLGISSLSKLVGQTRLLRDDDRQVFYPVRITNIALDGCNLKANFEVFDGMGTGECCLEDLFTQEEAQRWVEDETTQELIDSDVREATSGHYKSTRTAAFVKYMEKHASPEEIAMINEEYGSLRKVHDQAMRSIVRRVATTVRGVSPTKKIREDDDDIQ